MKILKLIPFAFLTLTACYYPDMDIQTDPMPEEYVFHGSSAVEFNIWELNAKDPQLPEQVTVKFEDANNLKVVQLPENYRALMGSNNTDSVFYGCDSETPHELPQEINANVVMLCGEIEMPANALIKANLLYFQNAHIKTKKHIDQKEGIIMFMVNDFNIAGDNSLRAVADRISNNMNRAPSIFVHANTVSGSGHLEIFSEKYTSVYKVK